MGPPAADLTQWSSCRARAAAAASPRTNGLGTRSRARIAKNNVTPAPLLSGLSPLLGRDELALVFSKLSPRDLARASCVCRSWRAAASDDLWRELCVLYYPSTRALPGVRSFRDAFAARATANDAASLLRYDIDDVSLFLEIQDDRDDGEVVVAKHYVLSAQQHDCSCGRMEWAAPELTQFEEASSTYSEEGSYSGYEPYVSCFGFWRASTASFHFVTLRGGDFRDGRVDSNGRLELTKRLELSPSAEMLASTLNKHLLVALTLDFTEGSILLSFETEDVDGAPQEDEIGDGEQDSDPVVHARYRILQEAEVEQALATLHWQGGHCRPS